MASSLLVGGVGMIFGAAAVFRYREGDRARKIAMRNFGFSILYLFALFAVLVVERIVTIATGVLCMMPTQIGSHAA